jgi:hypothetical protein
MNMSAAATVIENIEPLSAEQLEALEATREYQILTARQQLLVRAAVETGDIDLAVRQAYACKSAKHFKIMVHDVLDSPRVQAALRVSNTPKAMRIMKRYHDGKSERDLFIERLEKRIKSGDITVAQWKGMNLLCRLKGWAAPTSANDPAIPEGCDAILKNGKIIGYYTPDDQRVEF